MRACTVAFTALLLSSASGDRTCRKAAAQLPANPYFKSLDNAAIRLFKQNRFAEAAVLNRQGYEKALAVGARVSAARFLSNYGNCLFAQQRYREALQVYAQARDMAYAAHDPESAGAMHLNIASLYLQVQDRDAAAEEAANGAKLLARFPQTPYRAPLLLLLAKLRTRDKPDAAEDLFTEAIDAADRSGDVRTAAQAWNLLGLARLQRRRLDAAEEAFANAYRLRRLHRAPGLESCFRYFGALELQRGDLTSALRFGDLAVKEALEHPGRVPSWNAYVLRGRARLAASRTRDAVEDFRAAIRLVRQWRMEAIPSDSSQIATDAGLEEIYEQYIAALFRLYDSTRDPALSVEAFEASEENRAASLRALVSSGAARARLGPEYDDLLAKLRAVEAARLRRDDPRARKQARALRHRISEIEALTGVAAAPEPDALGALLETVQAALQPQEVLLSFRLAEPRSYLWTVTRAKLRVHPLAGSRLLSHLVADFAAAVREDRAGGTELYRALFGSLGASERGRRHWLLSLDDALFAAPLAALRSADGFLVEHHTLTVLPSAHFARRAAPAGVRDRFVAIADPISNEADPRRPRGPASPGLELPRLPATGAEARTCARAWPGPKLLLEGRTATRAAVQNALASHPAVLHFATHIVFSPDRRARMALSADTGFGLDLISGKDIAAWRCPRALVTLSGCNSAAGAVAQGAGLLGLTRGWVAAGAAGVVATLWPVPDDAGPMFPAFYNRIAAGEEPAAALQAAQLGLIRSGGWRARPQYWAAYVLFGRS